MSRPDPLAPWKAEGGQREEGRSFLGQKALACIASWPDLIWGVWGTYLGGEGRGAPVHAHEHAPAASILEVGTAGDTPAQGPEVHCGAGVLQAEVVLHYGTRRSLRAGVAAGRGYGLRPGLAGLQQAVQPAPEQEIFPIEWPLLGRCPQQLRVACQQYPLLLPHASYCTLPQRPSHQVVRLVSVGPGAVAEPCLVKAGERSGWGVLQGACRARCGGRHPPFMQLERGASSHVSALRPGKPPLKGRVRSRTEAKIILACGAGKDRRKGEGGGKARPPRGRPACWRSSTAVLPYHSQAPARSPYSNRAHCRALGWVYVLEPPGVYRRFPLCKVGAG